MTTTGTLRKFWNNTFESPSNELKILDVMTGAGKTTSFIEYLASNYMEEDFRVVYATRTRQEALEAILSLYRALLGKGMRKDNAQRFLKASHRMSFNFDGSNEADLKEIKELLNSETWSDEEKKFIKSICCKTNKFETKCHVIFATHASLALYAPLFSKYNVVIDELPTWAYNLKPSKGFKACVIKQHHKDTVEMSGAGFIDEDLVSLKVFNGLLDISDMANNAIVYHINTVLPFKSCVLMTAYSDVITIPLTAIGKNIPVIKTIESKEVVESALELLTIETLDRRLTTNKSAKEVAAELQCFVENNSKHFEVSTEASKSDLGDIRIATNKTGLNSMSEFNECSVTTQRNFNNFEMNVYGNLLGEEGLAKFWCVYAASAVLQSVFRGSIRNRKKMRLYLPSKMLKTAIIHTLHTYK